MNWKDSLIQQTIQPPKPDEIEISLFGRGYGECLILHLGLNKWIIIDSFNDPHSKQPIALDYLDFYGINPSDSVEQLILTHWHDDHIKGASQVLSQCYGNDFTLVLHTY